MIVADGADLLIVEDNPSDVELILRILKRDRGNLRITVLRDGAAALDYLFGSGPFTERGPSVLPRVIVLDLKLPKIDGLQVLRQIRSDARTRHVPVIMMTSSSEPKDVSRSYELGVNSYLVKPVEYGKLVEYIEILGRYWLGTNVPPSK
jgi:two-component system response regulator